MRTLWLYWEMPDLVPSDAPIISFLKPSLEKTLKDRLGERLISASEYSPNIKDEALRIYKKVIAKIGIAAVGVATFRKALKTRDGSSHWWFHKVSERDCESDSTFRFITEALIIRHFAESLDCREIVFVGGYKEVADTLRGLYKIKEVRCSKKYGGVSLIARGILSRIGYLYVFLSRLIAIEQSGYVVPAADFDIVFSSFWDWSVEGDGAGLVSDRYSKSLPAMLMAQNLKVGWFAWLDPSHKTGSKTRNVRDMLIKARSHKNIVILQKFLSPADVIRAVFNFKPLYIFLRYARQKTFKNAFVEEDVNFLPILGKPLLYGFINSSLPHLELMRVASRMAFKRYSPPISISFLELFLHSRAFYSGAKSGCKATIHCAMQHGSYGREKTFVMLHPEIEYKGDPDGYSVPKPDYIFAMGELGKEIFMESGFPEERVLLTGSARYEHIKNEDLYLSGQHKPHGFVNILLIPSLDVNLEMEMIDAVFAATEDIPRIRLSLRNHPFSRVDQHPGFRKYKDRMRISDGTLEDDLKEADLLIFTYSTVAEEAFIKGIPVWQWRSTSYNASAFRDLGIIPFFYSIDDLKKSMKMFIKNKKSFIPDEKMRDLVMRKCFYLSDGRSANRMSAELANLIRNKDRQ